VRLGQANVDENPDIAARFFITYLPAIYHVKQRQVRQLDFQSEAMRTVGTGRRDAPTLYALLDTQSAELLFQPWSSLWHPWGVIARTMGTMGRLAEVVKSWSTWSLGYVLPGWTEEERVFAMLMIFIVGMTSLAMLVFYMARQEYMEQSKKQTEKAKKDSPGKKKESKKSK